MSSLKDEERKASLVGKLHASDRVQERFLGQTENEENGKFPLRPR